MFWSKAEHLEAEDVDQHIFHVLRSQEASHCLRTDISLGIRRAGPGLAQLARWARENWSKSEVLRVLSDLECCQMKYLYIKTSTSRASLVKGLSRQSHFWPRGVLAGLKGESSLPRTLQGIKVIHCSRQSPNQPQQPMIYVSQRVFNPMYGRHFI